jgi:hypothetical protein
MSYRNLASTQLPVPPKRWPREAGKKPTTRELKLVRQHALAAPNTQNELVVAMLLREEGATQPQIIAATGAPHRNKVRQLSEKDNVVINVKKQGRIKIFKVQVH